MISALLAREAMEPAAGVHGTLSFGAVRVFTLEDAWVGNRPNVSCIPCGTYPLVLCTSKRFGRIMPRILHVPARSGILIHKGNTVDDVTGCILVGTVRDGERLVGSGPAFDRFYAWLDQSLASDTVQLVVSVGGPS